MPKHELTDSETSPATRQKIDTTSYITLRAVITNRQAAIIIGESGNMITSIRDMTAADVDVSDHLRGAIERILTVSGSVDQVATCFNALCKALLGEDIASVGTADSNELTLKLAVPHVFFSAIIGAGGYRLRQIMDASQTQIYASEFCLPLSSERTLSISGKAEHIGLAITEVGKECLGKKTGSTAHISHAYVPVSMFGRYGHPESLRLTKPHDTMITPSNPYGIAPASLSAPTAQDGTASDNIVLPNDPRAGPARGATKDKLTQQIYIPNDMVGAIIGKQGSKINEIRQLSGSHIKINEPDATRTNERLITVEGSLEQNQLALYMLYQRLESEKRRQ